MKCIFLRLDNREPVGVSTHGFDSIHVVGVARGHIDVFAMRESGDGLTTVHRWQELPVPAWGKLSVCYGTCERATDPLESEGKKINELEPKMNTIEKLRTLEERVAQKFAGFDKVRRIRNTVSHIKVFHGTRPVFDASGEHVQFEVKWRHGEVPGIVVWALESYEDGSPKVEFVSEIDGEEFVLQFGNFSPGR